MIVDSQAGQGRVRPTRPACRRSLLDIGNRLLELGSASRPAQGIRESRGMGASANRVPVFLNPREVSHGLAILPTALKDERDLGRSPKSRIDLLAPLRVRERFVHSPGVAIMPCRVRQCQHGQRLERDRAVHCGQTFLVPTHHAQDDSVAEPCPGRVRIPV